MTEVECIGFAIKCTAEDLKKENPLYGHKILKFYQMDSDWDVRIVMTLEPKEVEREKLIVGHGE